MSWELERLARSRLLERTAQSPSTEGLADFIVRITPRFTRPAHLAPLVRLLERALSGEQVRALVFAPPRHAKSQTLLHAIPWWLTARPLDTIGYLTYGAQFAEGQSEIARQIATRAGFDFSPTFNTRGEWQNTRGGRCIATGFDGSFLGKGFNLLLVDDPHKNRIEAESPKVRETVWDTYKGTIEQRLEPGASVIVTHQRWVDDDLIGRLAAEGGWERVDLPAINDEGQHLWPGRYSAEEFAAIRRTNEYNWWSQYMGSPRPKGGAVFKRAESRFEGSGKHKRRLLISVDAAGTEGAGSDYTVAMCLAFEGAGDSLHCNVVDVLRMKLEPQDAAAKIRAFCELHGHPRVVIEKTRDGVAQARALEAMGVRGLSLVPPMGEKYLRAQPVASAWNDIEGSRVAVPIDPLEHPWVADFLAEARLFTGRGDKHDDQVDALSQGWNVMAETVAPSLDDLGDAQATMPARFSL